MTAPNDKNAQRRDFRAWRASLGNNYSDREIALILGVSVHSVRKYNNGSQDMVGAVERIADMLDMLQILAPDIGNALIDNSLTKGME